MAVELPKPQFDVTNGIAVPIMPSWAYVKGLEDNPIWEFVSRQPGAVVQLSQQGRKVTFAPYKYKDDLIGLFATNIPWIIRDMVAAADASIGNIIMVSNGRLPDPEYLEYLTKIMFLQDEAPALSDAHETGGQSIFASQLGVARPIGAPRVDIGLTAPVAPPQATRPPQVDLMAIPKVSKDDALSAILRKPK